MRYWKHVIIIFVGTAAAVGAYTAHQNVRPSPEPSPSPIPVPAPTPTPAAITDGTGCDPALWLFVYHPARLKIIEQCKAITGVLVNFVQEADGDFHGRVHVDDQSLINADNVAGQHGYLVIEGICQYPVTQADAVGPCSSYNGPNFGDLNRFVGKRVQVSGSYVQDTQHNKGNGGWLEIHPVSRLDLIQ